MTPPASCSGEFIFLVLKRQIHNRLMLALTGLLQKLHCASLMFCAPPCQPETLVLPAKDPSLSGACIACAKRVEAGV